MAIITHRGTSSRIARYPPPNKEKRKKNTFLLLPLISYRTTESSPSLLSWAAWIELKGSTCLTYLDQEIEEIEERKDSIRRGSASSCPGEYRNSHPPKKKNQLDTPLVSILRKKMYSAMWPLVISSQCVRRGF